LDPDRSVRQPFSKKNPTQQQQFLEKMASAMTTIAFMLLSAVAANAANLRSPTTASQCSQCLAATSANGTYVNHSCAPGWTFWGQSCYQRQTGNPTGDWRQAKARCAALKKATLAWACSPVCDTPHLAVPNTLAENAFLTSTMNNGSKSYSWLGFDYSKAIKPGNSQRTWEDGSTDISITWRNVYSVDDNKKKSSQPVLFMRASGAWSFDPYTGLPGSTQYVCEVPARFLVT